VPVLFRGPEIVPAPPVALIAQIDGQEPVEVGQPFLGEHVEGERRPDRVGDALGLGPELADEVVRADPRLGLDQIRRIPELALALVRFHQLLDRPLQVPQHFDFGSQFNGRIGGCAHVVPSRRVSL